MLAQGKIPSDDLKAAFNSFVVQAEEFWLQPPNTTSPLGSAYYTFGGNSMSRLRSETAFYSFDGIPESSYSFSPMMLHSSYCFPTRKMIVSASFS